MWSFLWCVAFLQDGALDAGVHPLDLDRSGVRWARPFAEARRRAREEERLLLILPDNYMPTADGSTGMDLFRVRILCDDRVQRLLNHRFIPYYFNVFEGAAAFEQDALDFVVRVKDSLGKEEQVYHGGSPILVMDGAGRLVEELKTSMTPEVAWDSLQRILKKNGRFHAWSESERDAGDLEQARLAHALGDAKKARSLLRKDSGEEALLLAARIAREERSWRTMAAALEGIDGEPWSDDVLVENAYRLWFEKRFEEMETSLREVSEGSDRHAEARYWLGIALLHRGEPQQALGVWKELVQSAAQGPFVYRADWAFTCVTEGPPPSGPLSLTGRIPSASLLGSHYRFVRNADLDGPPR